MSPLLNEGDCEGGGSLPGNRDLPTGTSSQVSLFSENNGEQQACRISRHELAVSRGVYSAPGHFNNLRIQGELAGI